MTVTPDYLLIGHVTADLMPQGRIAGGTVSYAVRTAAAFGWRVGVLTSTIPGDPILDEITPYADVTLLPAEQTTTYENIYTSAGRTQYVRGVARPIGPDDIPEHYRGASMVHFAPIAGELDPAVAFSFPDALRLLTLQGWLRQWDADGRVHFRRFYDRSVLEAIGTVVFSEEDVIESPDMEPEYAATVEHLFVTRAEKGGTYYRRGEPTTFASPPNELVNPTGAGDVFAASLLASLPLLNRDYQRAVQVAAELGSHSVTRIGLPSAPTPEEVRAAVERAKATA